MNLLFYLQLVFVVVSIPLLNLPFFRFVNSNFGHVTGEIVVHVPDMVQYTSFTSAELLANF